MLYLAILCSLLLVYCYAGYPILVALFARIRPRPVRSDVSIRPYVSIILPVFNEEIVLRRCLNSLVSLDYPKECFEIVCGSDGSTDGTDGILLEFNKNFPFLKPHFFARRRGKMLLLNDLVGKASGEILLFVDADIALSQNSMLEHVSRYADPEVGGVAGRLAIQGDSTDVFKSESTFLSIETALRRNESAIKSTVGLYGGNYSMRRALWQRMPNEGVHDDFQAVLTILSSGKRLVFAEQAISTEIFARSNSDEFTRKTRFSSRGLFTLKFFPKTLLPFANRGAWMLWPHKILRWFTLPLGIGLVISTLYSYFVGLEEWLYPAVLIEIAGVLLVAIGYVCEKLNFSLPLVRTLYWFTNLNIAFAAGILEFLKGRQNPLWTQTTRVAEMKPVVKEPTAVHQ